MTNFDNSSINYQKTNPWKIIVLLVVFVFLGIFVGQFFGILFTLPFFNYDLLQAAHALTGFTTSDPSLKIPLLILQGTTAFFGFLVAPLFLVKVVEKKGLRDYFPFQFMLVPGTMILLIVLTFMVANSVIIEWNMEIDYGKISPAFEDWAKSQESRLKELTEYLTTFSSFSGFLLGLVVIAVLPAIGEELVFRGILQPHLHAITKNAHVAIWAAAFIFGLIHIQFYGVIPRILLGALFGYIYYWSGTLWYAVLAHFINNGFTLLMMYMYQLNKTEFDIESTSSVSLYNAVIALIICLGLLYYFRNYLKTNT